MVNCLIAVCDILFVCLFALVFCGFWFLVFGCFWFLVFGLWSLVFFGFWFLVFGFWFLDFGFWFLVFGFWFLVFQDRVSLCRPGSLDTHFVDQTGLELRNLSASASQVLGLKACATTAWQENSFNMKYN
jgi:hypothetical protein